MNKDKLILLTAKYIGVSGLVLLVALIIIAVGIAPLGEGPACYRFGAAMIIGVWVYERFFHNR